MGRMDAETRKIPSHEVTYGTLRDMVLFGHLEPGQPVTIQGLTRDLDAGMTPVREAIRRLAAEGALLPQGNRRVSVPHLTRAVVDQVAFARLSVEPHLAELAMASMSPELIAQLEQIDLAVDNAIQAGDVHGYLKANHRFHFALYEASGAPILVDIARSLWLRFGPSLRVVCTSENVRLLPDQHGAALAAMRAGDGPAVARAIEGDIAQGLDQVRLALASGEI